MSPSLNNVAHLISSHPLCPHPNINFIKPSSHTAQFVSTEGKEKFQMVPTVRYCYHRHNLKKFSKVIIKS